LTVSGGYVDVALDEAADRIRLAEKAAQRIPDNPLTDVLANLDQYLLDRVGSARS
jgi:hypothetical protein